MGADQESNESWLLLWMWAPRYVIGRDVFPGAREQLPERQMTQSAILRCKRVSTLRLTICLVVEQTEAQREREGLTQGHPASL